MLKTAVLALLFAASRADETKSSHFELIQEEPAVLATPPAVKPKLGAVVTENRKPYQV